MGQNDFYALFSWVEPLLVAKRDTRLDAVQVVFVFEGITPRWRWSYRVSKHFDHIMDEERNAISTAFTHQYNANRIKEDWVAIAK